MYSRSQDRSNPPIRVPEHYSGCAFSNTRPPQSPKQEPAPQKPPLRHPTPAKPSPPPPPREEPPTVPPPPPPALLLPPATEASKEEPKKLPSKPVGNLFGSLGSAFPFSHGIGFDEILIIGLILLLAQSGRDPDMILWLALLLFCG